MNAVLLALFVTGIALSTACALPRPSPAVVPGGSDVPPGGPDLVLHAVIVRQDRLVILVANDGASEFNSPIIVTVSDGAPRQIDLGTPLRPGEALEAVLNTEYVQRRAKIVVAVATSAEMDDANLDNNRLEIVIGPDQPLDLELESATLDPGDGHLVVTVRSRAPIPLVGVVTITVREQPPSNRLLATSDQPLDVAADSTQTFDLPGLIRPDLATLTVSLSTDAIADADAANDFVPR